MQVRPLEKGTATHSSILAWRILWIEEPGGLQSMGSQRVRHKWSDLVHSIAHFVFKKNKLSKFLHLGLQSELNILKDKETFSYCMIWSPTHSGFLSSRLMFSYCRNINQRSREQGLDCLPLRWLVSWCSVLFIDFKELSNSTRLLPSIILCFSFPLHKLTIGLKW